MVSSRVELARLKTIISRSLKSCQVKAATVKLSNFFFQSPAFFLFFDFSSDIGISELRELVQTVRMVIMKVRRVRCQEAKK